MSDEVICYWCEEPVGTDDPQEEIAYVDRPSNPASKVGKRTLHRACLRRMRLGDTVKDPSGLTKREAAEKLDLDAAVSEGPGGW